MVIPVLKILEVLNYNLRNLRKSNDILMLWGKVNMHGKPDFLYHYTTPKGFQGILTDKVLHFSHYRYTNDFLEIKYAQEFFKEIAEQQINASLALEAFPSEIRKILIDKEVDNIVESIIKSMGDVYLFSCCKHDNKAEQENGLLSMWRGYGSGGGLALRLDYEFLEEAVSKLPTCDNEEVQYFTSEEYKKEEHFRLQKKSVESAIEVLIEKFWGRNSRKLEDKWIEHIIEIATFLKHPGFKEEKEYRFALYENSKPSKLEPKIKLADSKNRTRYYVEVPIKPEILVKGIIVGPPLVQDKEFVKVLQDLCHPLGIKEKDIRKSEISYKGF